ncbi:hypothetical protein NPIL_458811 [Nephila pilipes]|uniref:Uncharacterized protein n=1 Tax=Nephila pilipes TaxID=299642 RepID=A0A8X6K1V2_NEPPI|nr:hypothetical protein NPIL_458811 [Nephila pilipes]
MDMKKKSCEFEYGVLKIGLCKLKKKLPLDSRCQGYQNNSKWLQQKRAWNSSFLPNHLASICSTTGLPQSITVWLYRLHSGSACIIRVDVSFYLFLYSIQRRGRVWFGKCGDPPSFEYRLEFCGGSRQQRVIVYYWFRS